MEDQGKRLLLAVAAAFGIMLLWSVLFPPSKSEKKKDEDQTADKKKGDSGDKNSPAPDKTGQDKKADGKKADGKKADGKKADGKKADGKKGDGKKADGKKVAVEDCKAAPIERRFKKIVAEFSQCGGTLVGWRLQGSRFENRGGKTKTQIDLAPDGTADTRSFRVAFHKESTYQIPRNATWQVTENEDPAKLTFTYPPPGVSSPVRVVKEYRVFPDDYLLQLDVKVRNLTTTEAKQRLVVSMYHYQDPEGDHGGGWTRVERRWKAVCRANGSTHKNTYGDLVKKERFERGEIQWAGFMHSYFLAAASPKGRSKVELECRSSRVRKQQGFMRVDLVFETTALKLKDEAPYAETVVAYMGPKYLDKLEAVAKVAGYNPGFDKAVDLGITSFIARPLLWLLQWFHSFVVNWGVAIILLTFMVKLATLYWTNKSMRSMKEMAKLKPEIEKLQKKYKDDKQRQQVEIMNLYKAHKVNPLAGCLPMLLQMPIWYALYQMLRYAAELYQAPFIPGWIDDLTAPDPLHILPIALMGMMFLQSKLTPTTADSTQQKIMMYGLPLMFGVFSFFFPAGLTLYILTNTCLTAGHHLYMHREDREAEKAKKSGSKSGVSGRKDGDAKADEADAGDEPEDKPSSDKSGNKSSAGKKSGGQNRSGKKSGRKRSGQKKKGSRKRSA